MRVRELLPFIDGQQEMVIRTSEGGKAVGGTAYDIINAEELDLAKLDII